MSRIGKKPVAIPKGVKVSLNKSALEVNGPKGTLGWEIPRRIAVQIDQSTSEVIFSRSTNERTVRALHGLARSLVANMVKGVTDGFTKSLEVIGVGYSAKVQGKDLMLAVGYSNQVKMPIPEGISVGDTKTVNVAMAGIGSVPVTTIVISGIDKQRVGQFAATVRAIRPPEPYKGKGIRYVGETVRRKAGKAMAGAE
ncbi:MAG TPA: 50S ribosomal protein L6 [Planctomycetota bacterium]|nr:50S ribosomal protein L6 [Planctomycetota bacterium]